MRFISPLRYPGGKANLFNLLKGIIELNNLRGCIYFEPYAGGAGAALNLLYNNVVSEIHINDLDKRVFAFWKAVLQETERFVDLVFSVPLSIEEWLKQRAICMRADEYDLFDIGFATFYINRCNRSGVLINAGPIGGYQQAGKWKFLIHLLKIWNPVLSDPFL